MNLNPIGRVLMDHGVALPARPLDLTKAIDAAGVKRVYVIAMTGRCGSTWLAEALRQLPQSGNPQEHFSEESIPFTELFSSPQEFQTFFTELLRKYRTGDVFGFKIDPDRMHWLSCLVDLQSTFIAPGYGWVDMRRLNIVKQAFSYARAKKSGVWHRISGGENGAKQVQDKADEFSDEVIWNEILNICNSEFRLEEFYKRTGLVPLRIMYEELLDSKAQLLRRVYAHMLPDRPYPEASTVAERTEKLSNNNEDPSELQFLTRHTGRVNDIYGLRGRFTGETIFSKVGL